MPNELNQLLRHMQWADASVWAAVSKHQETHGDTRTKDLLHHLHSVQWAYLQIWRGDALDMPDASTFADLAAIRVWCREYFKQLPQFLDKLDAPALQENVVFPWADGLVKRWGAAQPVTLAESILQTCSHSTYHRGQVNMRIRELGGEPPLVDFVAWIWMGRPEPEWEQPE
jgi:uncharacterized damage-inducible protein DinB